MDIHKKLRDLRLISGMTQEKVAELVHVTRQAISSYESGRTQPDIEMLIKLADVYGTDISSVLYGVSEEQKKLKRIRRTAVVVAAAVLLLVFAGSSILLFTNLSFTPINRLGLDTGLEDYYQTRFLFVHIGKLIYGAAGAAAVIGALAEIMLLMNTKQIPDLKTCFLYLLLFYAGVMLCTVTFSLADSVYTISDYLLNTLTVQLSILLLLIYRIILEAVRKHEAKR